PDLLYELSQFTALGVRLCHVVQDLQLPIVAQVTFADRVMIILYIHKTNERVKTLFVKIDLNGIKFGFLRTHS
ncbi:hypothetical protein O5965_24365, partial [Escherichia coli]|nr:hypothetical protein [Escherichia coli]